MAERDLLHTHIEALIFCATEPITISEIQECMSEMFEAKIDTDEIENAIFTIQEKYQDPQYAFSITAIAGGYQFLTKPEYQASIGILLRQKSKKKLSTSALETLAIIAYKQPITKHDCESIRGVNCDYVINKLLEKELIELKGKANTIGKPILYGTSKKFMEYFGISSLDELPLPKDFKVDDNAIGDEMEILTAQDFVPEPEIAQTEEYDKQEDTTLE